MPNAFTYSSPISGSYVAITTGLLGISSREEIEAVIGHELGHLKHRDVSWILALSIIPLAIYFLGRSLVYSAMFSGYSDRREQNNSGATLLLIGIGLIVVGFLFRLLIAHFNRLREYYADAHSTIKLGRGRDLERALTKIYLRIKESPSIARSGNLSVVQTLFIVAPLIEVNGGFFVGSGIDSLVEAVKQEKVNPIIEILSTHPPVPKRLRFIDKLLRMEAVR
jgi:heat shock protein HtpX